jgi:hypothetical protein
LATQIARYSLSVEHYDRMLKRQNGACAVCLRPPKDGRARLCVDHDHQTGAVRALLCNDCNSALGFMRENPEAIHRLAVYADNFAKTRHPQPPDARAVLRAKHTAYRAQRIQLREALGAKVDRATPYTTSSDADRGGV